MPEPSGTKERPLHSASSRNVRGDLWLNENASGKGHHIGIKFYRFYREDGDQGEWKETDRFFPNDMHDVARVADALHVAAGVLEGKVKPPTVKGFPGQDFPTKADPRLAKSQQETNQQQQQQG